MIDPEKTIDRNEKFGNKRGDIKPSLEKYLINEEAWETINALDEFSKGIEPTMLPSSVQYHSDLIQRAKSQRWEIIDWCIDIMFVAIWTLHKLGLTSEQITQAYDIVCESNMSKLWAWKNVDWKVKKWDKFIEPDFTDILNTL